MPENSRHLGVALFAAVLAFVGAQAARAQTLPSIDQALTLRSADNDPDLVAAREAYDRNSHTQSLYLRVNDGTPDRQAFSGQLHVRGAEVVEIIGSGEALSTSDAVWGIPGVNYGGNAPRRGLDGVDPMNHVPVLGDPTEAVRIEDPHTVRFYLGTDDDIDDLRVLIRYPAEPGPASFDIQLFHPTSRVDPLNWPMTQQGGIHVGSLVDAIPDDGDYSEVFVVRGIKLRIEDLDVVEESITVGEVSTAGGLAGPAVVTLDNYANGTDLDQDNGFDQNGLISPIPAGSDLEHLVFRTPSLTNERFGGLIPAEAIRVMDPPAHLAVGQSLPVSFSVLVPGGLPSGAYTGRMEVFEDNSGDGVRNGAEPFDLVSLTVIVGEIPDGGFDLGPPDFGFPDLADLGSADGLTVEPELADRGPVGEMGAPTDATADAREGDAEVGPGDVRIPGDGSTTPGRDGQAVRDGGAEAGGDGPLPADASLASEGGTPGRQDFGTPRGGAFSCHAAGSVPRVPLPWLLLVLGLAPLARRRR